MPLISHEKNHAIQDNTQVTPGPNNDKVEGIVTFGIW